MMEIKKIKVHNALTCGLEDSVKDVANKLKDKKERRIFAVDNSGKLQGVITTTDLVYKAFNGKNLKAGDIMTKDVKAVDISDELDKALEIMNDIKSFVCPVTDKGKILGVISYQEIINYLYKEAEK